MQPKTLELANALMIIESTSNLRRNDESLQFLYTPVQLNILYYTQTYTLPNLKSLGKIFTLNNFRNLSLFSLLYAIAILIIVQTGFNFLTNYRNKTAYEKYCF